MELVEEGILSIDNWQFFMNGVCYVVGSIKHFHPMNTILCSVNTVHYVYSRVERKR